jgi:3-hydroxyacyl-CoA dehydrogenase
LDPSGSFSNSRSNGFEKIVHQMDNMYEEYEKSRYKPSPVLKLIDKTLWRKTSKRFL